MILESLRHSTYPFLFVALSSLAAAQTTTEKRLDAGSLPGADHARVARIASSGSAVYVVWEDDRNGAADIYFNRSLDGGSSWLANDIRIDVGTSNSNAPLIACSGTSVYVIWSDDRNGCSDIYFNRSLDGGATWQASDARIDSSTAMGTTCSSSLAIAASGTHAYVTWTETANAAQTSAKTVRFRRSSNQGAAWLTEIQLDAGIAGSVNPVQAVLAASGSGVYVGWNSTNSSISPLDVYFNGSEDNGGSWQATAVRIDVGTDVGVANAYSPCIAAAGSKVYMGWLDYRDGVDVYVNRSLDGGLTWLSADVMITSSGAVNPKTPTIAASGDAVYVVWKDSQFGSSVRGGGEVWFDRSLDSGTTWLVAETRLNANGFGHNATLAADGTAVFVTWLDYREDPLDLTWGGDITFNRSIDNGTNWLNDARTIDSGSWVYATHDRPLPQLAASGSSAFVAWTDPRNGSGDVFFSLPLGYQSYGPQKAGSGGIAPVLSAAGTPSIGETVSIDVTDGLGGALCALAYTFEGRASISLRFGTVVLQRPWEFLTISLGGPSGVPGAGSGSLLALIPNDVSILGSRLNTQAAVFDSGATKGIALSRGLEVWVL